MYNVYLSNIAEKCSYTLYEHVAPERYNKYIICNNKRKSIFPLGNQIRAS